MSDKSTNILSGWSAVGVLYSTIPDKDVRFMSFSNGPVLLLDPPSLLFKGYTMGIFPGIKQKGREAHDSPLSSA